LDPYGFVPWSSAVPRLRFFTGPTALRRSSPAGVIVGPGAGSCPLAGCLFLWLRVKLI